MIPAGADGGDIRVTGKILSFVFAADRSVRVQWRPVLDWRVLNRHQVIIGTTGTGKTTP